MKNLRKIEAITAYFANYPNMQYLGKVKLMKLFYFLDFDHVKEYGIPVTYDTYYNLPHGPVPTRIKSLIDDVADDGENALLKDVITCEFPAGTRMCKIVPKRGFSDEDKSLLSESELDILKKVSEKYKAIKTDTIEQDSHNEAPWSETKQLEKIPYYLAAHDPNSKVTEDEVKLAFL